MQNEQSSKEEKMIFPPMPAPQNVDLAIKLLSVVTELLQRDLYREYPEPPLYKNYDQGVHQMDVGEDTERTVGKHV